MDFFKMLKTNQNPAEMRGILDPEIPDEYWQGQ